MSGLGRYSISVAPDQERQVREALAELGVEMLPTVPTEELMAMRETDHGNLYATSAQLPGMLLQVNRHLQDHRLTPGVEPGHGSWSQEQAVGFLGMCLTEFEWEEGKIAHTEIRDQDDWEDAMERWPDLPLEELE